jgi:hypothetical protein
MKIELTAAQKAWIQSEIAARRFENEAHARAYLTAIIDDAIRYGDVADIPVDELRRLWAEGVDSGLALDDDGNVLTGAETMTRIWKRVQAKPSL